MDNTGEISDGYHTFNELYYHRMILFSLICNANPDISWKSRKHSDGTMFYEKCFIVGINTPEGSFTYHYNDKYWDYFMVNMLDFAPEWDGHTAKDITRLLSLDKRKDYLMSFLNTEYVVLEKGEKLNEKVS